MKIRKIMGIVLAVLIGALSLGSLAGCTSPEQQAKDAATKAISSLTSSDVSPSAVGLDELDGMGISSSDFLSSALGKIKAEVTSVEASDSEATVTLSVTCVDLSECANLLASKADELKAGNELVDMDKDARYARAGQDLNESLEAAPSKTVDAKVEFSCVDGSWSPQGDFASVVVKAAASDADTKAVVSALGGYKWRFDDMNASQIIESMKAGGLTVGEIESYDESTDPNGKLGRPGYYTSKATWWDTRIEEVHNTAHIGGNLSNDMGGTIEVFDNVDDCKSRETYLSGVTSATGIGRMYTYRFGCALLRVTYDLLPSQAEEYEAVFRAMQG